MAWTNLSFTFEQVLTSSEMDQLQANFAAMAAGDAGAPAIQSGAIDFSGGIDVTAALEVEVADSGTNTPSTAMVLRHTTDGTTANGFGVGLSFEVENSTYANVQEMALIDIIVDDETLIDGQMSFKIRDNNILTEYMKLDATGLSFKDNIKLTLGSGGDLQIFHDATNSIVRNAAAAGLIHDSNVHIWRDYSPYGEYMRLDGSGNLMGGVATAGDAGGWTLYATGAAYFSTGSAGVVTASTSADDVVVEGSGNTGISVLGPDASFLYLMFGSPTDNNGAGVNYRYQDKRLNIQSELVGGIVRIQADAAVDQVSFSGVSGSELAAFAGYLGLNGQTPVAQVPLKMKAGTGAAAITMVGRTSDSVAAINFNDTTEANSTYVQSNGSWQRWRADSGFHFASGMTPTVTSTTAVTIEGLDLEVDGAITMDGTDTNMKFNYGSTVNGYTVAHEYRANASSTVVSKMQWGEGTQTFEWIPDVTGTGLVALTVHYAGTVETGADLAVGGDGSFTKSGDVGIDMISTAGASGNGSIVQDGVDGLSLRSNYDAADSIDVTSDGTASIDIRGVSNGGNIQFNVSRVQNTLPSEVMRVTHTGSLGHLSVGVGGLASSNEGCSLVENGTAYVTSTSTNALYLNRLTDDGIVLEIRQATTAIGTIGTLVNELQIKSNGSGTVSINRDVDDQFQIFRETATGTATLTQWISNVGGTDTITATMRASGSLELLDTLLVGAATAGADDGVTLYSDGRIFADASGAVNVATFSRDSGVNGELTLDFSGAVANWDSAAGGHSWAESGTKYLNLSTGSLYPETTNQLDLGSSSKKFQDQWLAGDLSIGAKTTASDTGAGSWLDASGLTYHTRDAALVMSLNRTGADGVVVRFSNDGTDVGSIDISGSTTTYNTTSDSRLKSELIPLKNIKDSIMGIAAGRGHFLSNPKLSLDMFTAQNLREQGFGYAVSEAEDEFGTLRADYSKMVPVAIMGIQDLYKITEASNDFAFKVENRVQALEKENEKLRERVASLEGAKAA